MRLQSTQNSCGPNSVSNALKALGYDISEDRIEDAVGKVQRQGGAQISDGTDINQLKRVLKLLKFGHAEIKLTDAEAAWRVLRTYLLDGSSVILSIQDDEHWASAIGLIGKNILVADGAITELVVSYDKHAMLKEWGNVGDITTYHGLAVVDSRKKLIDL